MGLNLMNVIHLNQAHLGEVYQIALCHQSNKADIYRLFELGLTIGSSFTILRKCQSFGVIELALETSRLCIDLELAALFLVTPK